MPNDEDDHKETEGPLIEALRQSGAPKSKHDAGLDTFQTNQGRVIAGSPADVKRIMMMRRMKDTVVRPRWGDASPAPLTPEILNDKELDIDFSLFASPAVPVMLPMPDDTTVEQSLNDPVNE